MGNSSTAVKKIKKFGAHISVPNFILYKVISVPNFILYKVTPFKIRDPFARET